MRKLFALILLVLMSPSLVIADTTRYITTGCANNGDGTAASCAGAPAGAGAWNTCANAVTGATVLTATNLVTAGLGNLIIDCSGSTVDGACTWTGITTDATHLIRQQTSGANKPIVAPWIDSTKYHMSSAAASGTLQINILYFEFDGLQVENTATGSGAYAAIQSNTAAALSWKGANSIFKVAACNTGGGGTCDGVFFFPNVANTKLTLYNTLSFGAGSSNYYLRAGGSNNGEVLIVYNNGAYGGAYGYRFDGNGASLTLRDKNNWSQSNATNGFFISGSFGTYTHNNNVTADASSPDVGGRSLTISFTNQGTGDYTLASSDTSAKDQGADLSADAFFAFSTDLQGHTRSGTWDVGPLEYQAPTAGLMSHNCTSGSDCRFNMSGGATSGGVQ